jgi:predicted nucleic acid-binding protein
MKCLVDVNALVALGVVEHEFHDRVTIWVDGLRSKGAFELLTCSITELGFVRVLAQTQLYGFAVHTARALLLQMKAQDAAIFTFVPDDHDIFHIPGWAKTPKQITDGHLAQLAKANGPVLATLDRKIPGSFLIPRNE